MHKKQAILINTYIIALVSNKIQELDQETGKNIDENQIFYISFLY